MKRILVFAAAIVTCVGVAQSARADSLLYRNDFSVGTDYLGQAIAASGYALTAIAGDFSDTSAYNLNDFNVVVYANQDNPIPGGDLIALNAYVAAGGKVIFDDWMDEGFNGGQSYTGNSNLSSVSVGAQFSAGLGSNPLALTNPGWFVTSNGMAGSVVAGTYDNGDAAIIVGNGGRTIVNGFLNDTAGPDSVQLYLNELASFASSPVPGPAIGTGLPGLLAGVGAMLAWYRKRRSVAV